MNPDVWTIRRLLEWTIPFFERKEVDSPRLSAELLLSHILKMPRIKLYTDYEHPLAGRDLAAYRDLVKRAAEHEPIAYLTGRAFFFGLEFEVNRDVLVPRPETETLVEHVIQFCRHAPGMEAPRILDLCTGTGCIAAALARTLKTAQLVATDISPAALATARRNLEQLGLLDRVVLAQGDLFAAMRELVDPSPFHIIVSNPPYIPTAQIPLLDRNVREYEPRLALDGGLDGLAPLRAILAGAADRLLPAGRFFIEIAFDQADLARQIASEESGLADIRILRDDSGRDRILTGVRA